MVRYPGAVDTITPQINAVIARWGNGIPAGLPDDDEALAEEYRHALALLATSPPDYQAGRLRVARDRIAQARRMRIPQAV